MHEWSCYVKEFQRMENSQVGLFTFSKELIIIKSFCQNSNQLCFLEQCGFY